MKTHETMKTNTNYDATGRLGRGAQRAARAMVVLVVATVAGCEVANPGLVEDKFLNEAVAHEALVRGAASSLAIAVNNLFLDTGHAAREILPSGQSGPGGVGPVRGAGHFTVESESDLFVWWEAAQGARWIAENALERFADSENEAPTKENQVQAYLWAGYANERLGENWCESVFDGGPKGPNSAYFERAETHFTNALALASGEQVTAAYAGRAQARMWLDKWSGAASDAAQVPIDFVYDLPADDIGNRAGSALRTGNVFVFGNRNQPYRAQTIHHTWFYDYYLETGDPRSSWGDDPDFPFGTQSLPGYPGGTVPWSYTTKYVSLLDPFRLSTGREMVLLRAEALLVAGDWAAAMTLINDVRTASSRPSPRVGEATESLLSHTTSLHAGGSALVAWHVTSSEDAWTALKRERAIEMWLEGRRMGDLRRWKANNRPGDIDWPDWESLSFHFVNNPPVDCVPVPRDEIDANSNF